MYVTLQLPAVFSRNGLSVEEILLTLEEIARLQPRSLTLIPAAECDEEDLATVVGYAAILRLAPLVQVPATAGRWERTVTIAAREHARGAVLPVDGEATLRIAGDISQAASSSGLQMVAESGVTSENNEALPEMVTQLAEAGCGRLRLLVADDDEGMTPENTRGLLRLVRATALLVPFPVSLVEMPQFRRAVFEHSWERQLARRIHSEDARTSMYIAANGDVFPSPTLSVGLGNVRETSLQALYHHSSVYRMMREPKLLRGTCAGCSFKMICGGSRARAWNLSGDLLAEDPACRGQSAIPVQFHKATSALL